METIHLHLHSDTVDKRKVLNERRGRTHQQKDGGQDATYGIDLLVGEANHLQGAHHRPVAGAVVVGGLAREKSHKQVCFELLTKNVANRRSITACLLLTAVAAPSLV